MNNRNIKVEGVATLGAEPSSLQRAGTRYKRVLFQRTFTGDIQGTSVGESFESGDFGMEYGSIIMIETFTGSLLGRQGTFDMVSWHSLQCGSYEGKTSIEGGTDELEDVYGYFSTKVGKEPTETTFILDLYPPGWGES